MWITAPYIEQPVPDSEQWEVVTKIDDFMPAAEGYQAAWNRIGFYVRGGNSTWMGINFGYRFINNSHTMYLYGQSQFVPGDDAANNEAKYKSEFSTPNAGNEFSTFYLKLRKTVNGYSGWFSLDGEEWTQATALVRNPFPPDGTIPGTIRIYTSANATTGNTRPALVDYVRATDLGPSHPFANDEFDGASLSPAWEFLQGHNNNLTSSTWAKIPSTMEVSDGSLKIVSGPQRDMTNAEANTRGDRLAMVSRPAPAGDEWSVYTKVAPLVFEDTTAWKAHGIRIWKNQYNWLAISTGKNGSGIGDPGARPVVETNFRGDDNTSRSSQIVTVGDSPSSAGPAYLRIDRNGDRVRALYSFDGITWTPINADLYADGWLDLAPSETNQPWQVQLYVKRPRPEADGGYFETSEFDFIREFTTSTVRDWQLH